MSNMFIIVKNDIQDNFKKLKEENRPRPTCIFIQNLTTNLR